MILLCRLAGTILPASGLRKVLPLESTVVLNGSKIGTRAPLFRRVSEKSPANCWAVGTLPVEVVADKLFERSKSAKKNVRFFPLYFGRYTGPPTVPPKLSFLESTSDAPR